MIVYSLVPYFRFEYGEDTLDFFTPEVHLVNEDQTWDNNTKIIHNLRRTDFDDLDGETQIVIDVAQNPLNRVVQDFDNNSISTLGNDKSN